MLTYGSLFSGAGGIDIGLDNAGMSCKFQVEIDENCQQILQYNWPNVLKFKDIKNVNGYDLPEVDLIAFGSPCQDLSTAGNKTGLYGNKSILFYEATRIIKEMRAKTNGQYPKWSIWENVVGALSSNGGSDFGQVLREMDEAGAHFSEWAVLDAQYFGIPQQRRRVYVISVYDSVIAKRCPEKIFSLSQGSDGNSSKSIKREQKDSTEIASCLRSGGQGGVPSSRGEHLVVESEKRVRRLTPIEWERLMGWPDNHTLFRIDGQTNSDTIRYKMCGNGAASPVVKWIADQIKEI
jgi:DNA (cytosine-5)-methyltransferase 1